MGGGQLGESREHEGYGKKRERVEILIFFCCIFVNSSLSLFQGFVFMLFILISSFNVRFHSHLISFPSIYAM